MTELLAWALFPLLALAVCCGAGLLAERAGGLALPAALVPPLGLCAAIALVGPVYALGLGAWAAAAVLGVAAAAGAWLARDSLARLRPGAAALAGGLAYGLHMAPVALTGEATFLGYNLLNDTAIHFALVDHVTEHGRHEVRLEPSSYAAALGGYVGKSYPLGSHELLAALRWPLDVEVARIYQPFIALAAALTAAAVVAMVRAGGLGRAGAALAGVAAVSGQLLLSFTLQGGIKELTFVAALATAAALGAELLRAERPARGAAVLALPLLAAYAIYGVAALAWIGPLVVALAAFALAARGSPLRRRLPHALAAGAAAFALLGAPTIVESVEFYSKGEQVLTSEAELGPLAGPLQPEQALGVWLRGDYRLQPEDRTATNALLAVAALLALLGALLVARRRWAGPALLVLPAAAAWVAVSPSGSPYVDAKLLAVASPAAALLSALGVAALWRGRTRALAGLAAAALAGGVLVSDAYAYRLALPAPIERLEELREASEAVGDAGGPMLLNEFEEYAKHFGRAARAFNPYEPWTVQPATIEGEPRPLFGHAYTLDELSFGYYASYATIALRRSPAESRPPVGYRRIWSGRWYEVWRRDGEQRSSVRVPLGFPERDPVLAAATPSCRAVRELSASAEMYAAARPAGVVFDVATHEPLPPSWERHPARFTLVARGAGKAAASARTQAGRHRVWLKGSLHRRWRVRLDGREVGTAKHLNGPGQWVDVATVTLGAGTHTIEVERPGGSLAPGDAQGDILGPVVLEPAGEARLVRVPRGDGRHACGRPLDWLERLPTE